MISANEGRIFGFLQNVQGVLEENILKWNKVEYEGNTNEGFCLCHNKYEGYITIGSRGITIFILEKLNL